MVIVVVVVAAAVVVVVVIVVVVVVVVVAVVAVAVAVIVVVVVVVILTHVLHSLTSQSHVVTIYATPCYINKLSVCHSLFKYFVLFSQKTITVS